MNFAFSNHSLASMRTMLAETSLRMVDESGVMAALLLTLVGIALRVYVPRHQMETEEHVKDGKLTPTEARRQVRFYEISSTVVTLLGVAVLMFVLYDLAV